MIISPFYGRGNRGITMSPQERQLRKAPWSSGASPRSPYRPRRSYPVAAAMTQPPCSAAASTQQPSGSWLRPRL